MSVIGADAGVAVVVDDIGSFQHANAVHQLLFRRLAVGHVTSFVILLFA
jgi:hypothetical protein